MAKETKTEYEEAERTIKKIQCDECETTWDDRDEDGHNLVVLNATIERKGFRGSWDDQGFEPRYITDDYHRMNGDASVDLCDSCLDGYFPDEAMMEVEEPDYYVKENEVTIYSCDFCDEEMGESATHEVVLNPVVIRTDRVRAGVNAGRRERTIETRELKDMFCETRNSSYETDCDGQFDCCAEDAFEIFGYDTPSWQKPEEENTSSKGFLKRLFGM